MLEDRAETQPLCLRAKLAEGDPRIRILGGENRLAGADERLHLLAPLIGKAVFGQRPIEVWQQVGDLVAIILQADGQAARVGFVGQPHVIVELVLVGEPEPRVVGIAIDVVGLDAIEALRLALPDAELLDCSNLIRLIRMAKSKAEIERLTRAAEISEKAMMETLALAYPGISLAELTRHYRMALADQDADLDHFCIGLRGLGMVTEPEYELKGNDVVFVDCGCIYRHYFSDTGTTLAFGELPEPLKTRHEALHACVMAGMEAVRPGTRSSAVREAMWRELTKRGYCASNPHGHGLGLEVRDYPTIVAENNRRIRDDCVDLPSDLPLEPDMVINLEGAMFAPGVGSIQVEHSYLVTKEGCRYLVKQDRNPFLSDR